MPPCKEEDTKNGSNVWLMDDYGLVSQLLANDSAVTNPLAQDAVVDSKGGLNKNLWWIHGNGYDLHDFVERHPGGREAIMLGKGRDCTALVESYHAFSSGLTKILEKYLVAERNKKAPQVDFFYSLLKERVIVELKAQGLDPQADRGAGWGRTMYYGVVILALLTTGYLHAVKVRLCAWLCTASWFLVLCLTYPYPDHRDVSSVPFCLLGPVGSWVH
jgi:cytochrome b involved in lipid metabolism